MIEFQKWPSISRLTRDMVITEKLDGTNAAVLIIPCDDLDENDDISNLIIITDGCAVFAQSRTRFITPREDNYGFAGWVADNADALVKALGPGRHFGEWWGQGIQRKYGMDHKRFSLFNVHRYGEIDFTQYGLSNVDTVPVLYVGDFDTNAIDAVMKQLEVLGSTAAPEFMKPEGIIVFHKASNTLFKKTIEGDEVPKSVYYAKEAV